jgi:hypothetical protein
VASLGKDGGIDNKASQPRSTAAISITVASRRSTPSNHKVVAKA